MGGIRRICKLYGSIIVKGQDGKNIRWLWDYVNDEPRLESEMTKEEISASERKKWEGVKDSINKN